MSLLRSSRVRLALIAVLVMAALPCFAGEVAVLKNGFSIRHERREIIGDVTRLYVTVDGASFVDVPTAEIEHFEAAPKNRLRPRLPASAQNPHLRHVRAGSLANYARNGRRTHCGTVGS